MPKITKKIIESTLAEAEQKYNLNPGLLSSIYNAEASVVFLGLRRGIIKQLRRIIQKALEGEVNDT